MGKEKAATPSLWQELFLHAGLYKRSQGRITRQVTFAALAIGVALGVWELGNWLAVQSDSPMVKYVIPGLLLAAGVWVSYRVVNLPRFADFLIAVEAEMNKVSWPTRTELIRSSMVVIFVMFFLAFVLYVYDFMWIMVFKWIGVLHGGGS